MATKVAVVTGSNKGVGFGIVRALCQKFQGDVYLTSRDDARGQTAVKELEGEGLKPKFHQLDINDQASIVKLRDFLQQNYGGLDLLVNNAGIAYPGDSTVPFPEQATVTTKTNYFATKDVCDTLFPILKPHARVTNVSSMVSQFALAKCSDDLKTKLVNPDISMDEITSLLEQFIKLAQEDKHQAGGFPNTAYGMSKVGVTVMSMIQQRELDKQGKEDIVVNACCPGYVNTDMTKHKGKLTIDEGAVTPVYCSLLAPNISEPRGKLIRECQVSAWEM